MDPVSTVSASAGTTRPSLTDLRGQNGPWPARNSNLGSNVKNKGASSSELEWKVILTHREGDCGQTRYTMKGVSQNKHMQPLLCRAAAVNPGSELAVDFILLIFSAPYFEHSCKFDVSSLSTSTYKVCLPHFIFPYSPNNLELLLFSSIHLFNI